MSSLLPVPEYRLVHSSSDMTEHAKRPVPEVGQATTGLERRALVAAADHTRELVDAIVRLDVDSPAAPELNERLESVLEFLRRHVQPAEAMIHDPSIESWEDYVDRSPVSGRLNPLAPPLDFAIGDDHTARSTTRLGLAYQGPPGRVHGGIVATLLDHIMGYAAGTVGRWIFTRTLTIDYDQAVPLFDEIELVARVEQIDGRKIWVTGEILAGGVALVRARGLWLPPRNVASSD